MGPSKSSTKLCYDVPLSISSAKFLSPLGNMHLSLRGKHANMNYDANYILPSVLLVFRWIFPQMDISTDKNQDCILGEGRSLAWRRVTGTLQYWVYAKSLAPVSQRSLTVVSVEQLTNAMPARKTLVIPGPIHKTQHRRKQAQTLSNTKTLACNTTLCQANS